MCNPPPARRPTQVQASSLSATQPPTPPVESLHPPPTPRPGHRTLPLRTRVASPPPSASPTPTQTHTSPIPSFSIASTPYNPADSSASIILNQLQTMISTSAWSPTQHAEGLPVLSNLICEVGTMNRNTLMHRRDSQEFEVGQHMSVEDILPDDAGVFGSRSSARSSTVPLLVSGSARQEVVQRRSRIMEEEDEEKGVGGAKGIEVGREVELCLGPTLPLESSIPAIRPTAATTFAPVPPRPSRGRGYGRRCQREESLLKSVLEVNFERALLKLHSKEGIPFEPIQFRFGMKKTREYLSYMWSVADAVREGRLVEEEGGIGGGGDDEKIKVAMEVDGEKIRMVMMASRMRRS